MFSDIRGFTTISETMGARQLSAFLNEYMTAMTQVVMDHNGTVDKFIGDAIMAIWGAPLDDADHAQNAVAAALEMLAQLKSLAPHWKARELPEIDIGIGINTGLVRVGNMGSNTRFDYTVLGDEVNLASRLEGLNKEYGTHVLVTEATRDALAGSLLCRPVDRVRVKGKLQPVDIYEPLCRQPATGQIQQETDAVTQALADFRARNFARARQRFADLNARNPQTLYQVYLTRIEEFEKVPPPADWDGVAVFTTK
jgi:adenylate cyclase